MKIDREGFADHCFNIPTNQVEENCTIRIFMKLANITKE